jgi:uncharacterized MAPEG superfamily protein
MTNDLTYLAWTLVLAVVQIFAFAFVRTKQYGTKWNAGPRDAEMPPLGPIAGRLERAQVNLFETLPLFIGAVLIAHAAGVANDHTALGAALYFWGRVVYVPLYVAGVPFVRSAAFMVALVGLGIILVPLLGLPF